MNSTINNRIAALRAHIAQEQIQAFIIPSTDPHLSEYVAPHWQSREWISGFTGSAGTVVVTAKDAGLWTDSRYFLQAARQLEGTGIALYKEMLTRNAKHSRIPECAICRKGDCSGHRRENVFCRRGGTPATGTEAKRHTHVKSIADPMQLLWSDRPAMPLAPAFVYDTKYAGNELYGKAAGRPAGHGSGRVQSPCCCRLWTR